MPRRLAAVLLSASCLMLSTPGWSQGMLPSAPAVDNAVAALDDPDEAAPSPTPPPGTPVLPTTHADRRFFRLACAYNQFTVDAAREAERANDAGLKALAKSLTTRHADICARLKPIAVAHGELPIRGLDKQGLDRQRDALLLDLKDRASGLGFDRAYASRMRKTQEEIINLYEKAAREDTSPDVRRFAAETLPVLHGDDAEIQAADARLR